MDSTTWHIVLHNVCSSNVTIPKILRLNGFKKINVTDERGDSNFPMKYALSKMSRKSDLDSYLVYHFQQYNL